MYCVTPALSLTGEVFGMHATAVNPPVTAESVPVATVSLCSWPGSRRCTCMSIRPGTITTPFGTSTTIVPSSAARFEPTPAMRSPSMRMSNTPSRPLTGSTTRPPLSSRFMFHSAGQKVQHCHPDGHAVGDLLENDRIRAVRDLRGDLDPAVHRSRVHDDDVGLRAPYALLRHPEQVEIFAERRKERALHPLLLDPQHHHHVRIAHRLVDRARDGDAELFNASRHEGW